MGGSEFTMLPIFHNYRYYFMDIKFLKGLIWFLISWHSDSPITANGHITTYLYILIRIGNY